MVRFEGQEGSMTAALIATIVVGGLALALVGTTMTGQKKVQHDRNYQLAINGADAGVNQAINTIASLPLDSTTTALASTEDLDVGDVTYSWSAQKSTPISWRITATGELNGTERTVEALAVRQATFFLAAFADIGFTMTGDNAIRSYDSTSITNNGAAGSNGVLTIRGNGIADVAMLMGTGASWECTGQACDVPQLYFPTAFDLAPVAENIQEAMDAACTDGFTAYNADTAAALQGGQTYCFSSVTLGNHKTFPIENNSREEPVIIYMTGNLTTGNHSSTNCGSGCTITDFPDAASLQIYSLGSEIALGNNSKIVAAIAAPYANCIGSPSNAQADIYGAIVCNDLRNQGGWNFNFDERLLNLGDGHFDLAEYREEVGGSTSWPD
jgi:hypothetical protein